MKVIVSVKAVSLKYSGLKGFDLNITLRANSRASEVHSHQALDGADEYSSIP
jgi:hypothetical protein